MNQELEEMKAYFWQRLSIAETIPNSNAINECAHQLFEECKDDYKRLTMLIMAINHKSWFWDNSSQRLMSLYSDLYYKYDDKAINYLENKPDELHFYLSTLD